MVPFPLCSLSALDPTVNKFSATVIKYLTQPIIKRDVLFELMV